MTLWATVVNGVVQGTWSSDSKPTSNWGEWHYCENVTPEVGWLFDGTTFTQPKPRRITSTQFLNRLPPAVLPGLASNPPTLIMLITLAAAGSVDLTDPGVQGGINALVPSVLTAAEAAIVLDH